MKRITMIREKFILGKDKTYSKYLNMGWKTIKDTINNVSAADIYSVREKLIVLSLCLTSSDIINPIPNRKEHIIALILPNV